MATRTATRIVDCDSHIVPRVDLDSLRGLLPDGLTEQARDMYAPGSPALGRASLFARVRRQARRSDASRSATPKSG